MRIWSAAVAWLVACGLLAAPVQAVDLSPAEARQGNALLATDCTPVTAESSTLPPRPILARRTFAAHMPAGAHRPVAKRRTLARKPVAKRKAAKTPVHRRIVKRKKTAARPAPRHRPTVARAAHPPVAASPAGAAHRPALRRVTFASPICADRAPVMEAFGVGPAVPADDLGQYIQQALAPENVGYRLASLAPSALADGLGSNGGSAGTPGSSAFPGITPIVPGGFVPVPVDNGETGDTPGDAGGDTPGIPALAVPEPAAWLSMILGFGAIGMTLRRRRGMVGGDGLEPPTRSV